MTNITTIYVDTRECKLRELLEKNGTLFVTKSLELGDILIEHPNRQILVERKTITDFNASLMDGRYKNQKLRLLEWRNKMDGQTDGQTDGLKNAHKNIVYLFEEKTGDNKDRAYWGALVNMILRDNIGVIQCDGLTRTAQVITDIKKKLDEDKFDELEGGSRNISLEGYAKGKYNTPKNCYLGQLSLIPGLSSAIAEKIAEKYPNMRALLDEMDVKTLANIRISEKRRLGDKLAEKIHLYIFQEEK
jgi:ERCC4-type nuclease